MSDEMEYYADEIKKIKERVNKCNISIVDSLEFFMDEANHRMTGISEDIVEEIKEDIKTFKKNCHCTTN